MQVQRHFQITGTALWNWFKAQCYDSLAVALLWLLGLLLIGVPWAPFWAVLAGLFQFIPHLGPILGMLGPLLTALFARAGWMPAVYVLIVYAAIMVIDGLLLQPYLMRRSARVPIWASILVPLLLGLFLSVWWVILAAPLLAIVYAYKAHYERTAQEPQVEIIPPEQEAPREDPPSPPTLER